MSVIGVQDAMRKVRSVDGTKGFFRGFGTQFVGATLYRSLYFGLFETANSFFVPNSKDENADLKLGLIAQTTTATARMIAYPFDTMRLRLQMDGAKTQKYYTGAVDCFRKTLAQEGATGFWKGATFSIAYSTSGALGLVLYKKYVDPTIDID